MADHVIKIEWQAQGEFSHEGFERRHSIQSVSYTHLTLPTTPYV